MPYYWKPISKPAYTGMSILELSKVIMYEIHYDYIKSKWVLLKPQTTDPPASDPPSHRLRTTYPLTYQPLTHQLTLK